MIYVGDLTEAKIKLNYKMQNSSFSINSSERTNEEVLEAQFQSKRGYRHTSLIYGTQFYSDKVLFRRQISFKSEIL